MCVCKKTKLYRTQTVITDPKSYKQTTLWRHGCVAVQCGTAEHEQWAIKNSSQLASHEANEEEQAVRGLQWGTVLLSPPELRASGLQRDIALLLSLELRVSSASGVCGQNL